MESQNKSMNGYEGKEEVRVANKRGIGTSESLLRLLAMALTLSAAVILGVDKQNKVVSIKILDALPPMEVPVSAKWHYLSAFVYFVVTNAIASAYAAISLVLSMANRGGGSGGIHHLAVFVGDVAMMSLLFSSNGAAGAIGLMGYKGNSHVQWKKVCHVFDKFCNQGIAALPVSLLGAIAFFALVILAAKRLHGGRNK